MPDNPLALFDWLIVHGITVRFSSEHLLRIWHARNPTNPVKQLIDSHDPDILIVNEFLPDMNTRVSDSLIKHYKTVIIDRKQKRSRKTSTTALIATKYDAVELDIEMPRQQGGGACGLYIPELNTSIVAFHPAALHWNLRRRQIRHIADALEEEHEKGRNIVAGGDCNAELSEIERSDRRFETLPIQNCSSPSFPNRHIMARLNRPWWWPLKMYVGAVHGMLSIDNIFVPESWKVEHIESVETGSDHEAVVVRALLH